MKPRQETKNTCKPLNAHSYVKQHVTVGHNCVTQFLITTLCGFTNSNKDNSYLHI